MTTHHPDKQVPTRVDVCIVTYRRPDLLSECLNSLNHLDVHGVSLTIIIIDNDPLASAKNTAKTFQTSTPYVTRYVHEPNKGLAFARNRALNVCSGDFIAFIDDDETVSREWLSNMLKVAKKYGSAAVFGPVKRVFSSEVPSWITGQSVFRSPHLATGDSLPVGASNNVLFVASAFRELGLKFDLAFSETGGEDIQFFYAGFNSGLKYTWCAEAIVFEKIENSRASIRWIKQRHFRNGQSFWRIYVSRYSRRKKMAFVAIQIPLILFETATLPVRRLVGRFNYVRVLGDVCGRLGSLSMLFGSKLLYLEYSAERYRRSSPQEGGE